MSVQSKLFINSKYSINEIQKVLDRTLKTKSLPINIDLNYVLIIFDIDGEKRTMHVFLNHKVNGFLGTLLNLNSNGKSVYALQSLAHVFGGFLCKWDNQNNYDGYIGGLNSNDNL